MSLDVAHQMAKKTPLVFSRSSSSTGKNLDGAQDVGSIGSYVEQDSQRSTVFTRPVIFSDAA